jgi:transcription elongation factor Elf1
MKKITPETVNCPKCKPGVLFNTTSRLSAATGVMTVKCDKCGVSYAFKVS